MPNIHYPHDDHHNHHRSDPPEGAHPTRLDVDAGVERSWSGVGPDDRPLTVRATVHIVTGGRVRAVAAAQGRALLALLKALAATTDPRVDHDEEERQ